MRLTPMWGQRGSPDIRDARRFVHDHVHVLQFHEEVNRYALTRAGPAAERAGKCLFFGRARDEVQKCSGGEAARRAARAALAVL